MEQTIQTSLEPTEKKKLNKANILMACLMLLMLAVAITFAVLWGIERNKHSVTGNTTSTVPEKDCSPCSADSSAGLIRSLTFDPAKIVNDTSDGYYTYSATYSASAEDSLYGYDGQALLVTSPASSPNKAKLILYWSVLGPMFDAAQPENTETETLELEFPQNISEIFISRVGQAVGLERILFLMADGTVEYIPLADAVKNHEFKSAGKLEGLSNIVKFYIGGFNADGGVGGGAMSYAQDADGNIYLLYNVSHHD